MKVAVSATGRGLDALVEPRFGRAPYFVVVDTATGQWEVLENRAGLDAVQGAGIQTAKRIAQLGAQAVITGNVGPKAFSALQAAGVKVYSGAAGTVREALEQLRAEQLVLLDGANVEGRWA